MPRREGRRWYSLDLPAVLVFCLFVLVVECILLIAYYRRQVALIPEIGRAAPPRIVRPQPPNPEPLP